MFLFPQFLGSLALLSAVLSMSGCADDLMSDAVSPGRTIRFDVSETDGWQSVPQSRAAADTVRNPAPQPSGVLTLQGETPADTFFLHASVTHGIDGTRFVRPTAETRAAPVTDEEFYESFGVLATIYDEWDEKSCTPNFMYDVEVTEESGWTTSYLWPGRGWNVRFFAYAPYRGEGVALSDKTVAGTPEITYTVPDEVKKQNDLCVALTDDTSGSENSVALLTFDHVLTAVRFTTGDRMLSGKISKITLKGVYGKATLAMGSKNWTGHGSAKDFSQEIEVKVDGSEGQEITSEVATFMMLPQILPDKAQIEIVYTDNLTSTERRLTASIGGTSWLAGQTVVYKISTTSIDVEPFFSVSTPEPFSHLGGTGKYTVVSAVSVSDKSSIGSQMVPVGWTAEFVEGDDVSGYTVIKKPEWIDDFTFGDKGSSGYGESYDISVSPQKSVPDNPHNDALRAAPDKGTVGSPYNLSNATGASEVERTANCYVINAPGVYSLPLVYGNAIDKDKVPRQPYYNTSAYTTSHSGYNILRTFIRHDGKGIENPYIYQNPGIQVTSAKLLWQDVKGLVSDVGLSSNGQSLVFTVDRETIGQGNAVVAVYSGSQVLWSWHIWVTDYELGDDLTTVTYESSYKMMPYNLGWCDSESEVYEARSVQVRFTQKETKAQQIITIKQNPFSSSVAGNNPYYQWGRKDPMLPAAGTGNTNKTWYDEFGNHSTKLDEVKETEEKQVITYGILNPATFLSNNTMEGTYYNLWAADNDAQDYSQMDITVKSVYDPCPVGYKVPPGAALWGLIMATSEPAENDKMNGMKFQCDNGTIFLPAIDGRDHYTGKITDFGTWGFYWSSATHSNAESYCLRLQMTEYPYVKTPLHGTNKSYGYPIRPVQE